MGTKVLSWYVWNFCFKHNNLAVEFLKWHWDFPFLELQDKNNLATLVILPERFSRAKKAKDGCNQWWVRTGGYFIAVLSSLADGCKISFINSKTYCIVGMPAGLWSKADLPCYFYIHLKMQWKRNLKYVRGSFSRFMMVHFFILISLLH